MAEANNDAPPDLPPLTDSEKALVARFPLPGQVPDALVNKKLLAGALDVSATTIDTWLIHGLPVAKKGTNGSAYAFRLSVAFAWRQSREASEEAARNHSEEATAQLRMELLGGSTTDRARASLSMKEQKEAIALEAEYMKAARLRRELMQADDVASAMEAAFSEMRDSFDSTPDRLARELNLPPEAVEVIQSFLDQTLTDTIANLKTRLSGG